jgi:hypothetical protein
MGIIVGTPFSSLLFLYTDIEIKFLSLFLIVVTFEQFFIVLFCLQ